ncbi:MAG TPA: hypothetical protein VGI39_20215 [Polyangiaceae bacterium]|jgi:hypothetical protein
MSAMARPDPSDLLSLDRDVARADAALRKWRRAVTADPQAHADAAPLDPWRHVTGQSTYEALGALSPTDLQAPHRDALRRWVYTLLQARLAIPVDAELAKAAADPSARLALPKPTHVSWRQAWSALLTAPTTAERSAALDALTERGPALTAIVRRRRERRDEVAHRLGFASASLFEAKQVDLSAAAEAFLTSTDDLAKAQLRSARAKLELASDPPLAVDAIAIALARDAPEGWPVRLSRAWLEGLFGTFARGLRLEVPAPPAALGASSFARACGAFGGALRRGGGSPSLPFALARDPESPAPHRFAGVFGALPSTRAFQKRALGCSARVADGQSRVLLRSALLHLRLEAARVLLRGPVDARERFEETTHRLFGAPLPPALAGAWPLAADDQAARFLGLLTAIDLSDELTERFDEDWFANPRAVLHLRALASGPAHEEPLAEPVPKARQLGRRFEQALG